MAFLNSRTGIRTTQPSSGGGGRGPTDYWPGGGNGGGGRGGDDNLPSYRERLRRYRMLIAFGLTSVIMIFVSFTTAYVVRKADAIWDPARSEYVSDWVPTNLPVAILLVNTLILLMSSLTLEMARRRAAEDVVLAPIASIPGIRVSGNRSVPWVWATIVLGLTFLAGQYLAWRQLRLNHINIAVSYTHLRAHETHSSL